MDDDSTLLQAWRDGDAEAGDALFGRHFSSLFRFFRNKSDDTLAEELTQNTFLAILAARDRFQGRSTFRTYAFAIARRQLLMHLRRAHVEQRIFDPASVSVAELSGSPGSIVAAKQEQQLLLRALRRLPVDHQIAIELYYWEGLSTAEVASVLEVAEGTVRSRLARIRERLATLIVEIAAAPGLATSTIQGFETWARSLRDLP